MKSHTTLWSILGEMKTRWITTGILPGWVPPTEMSLDHINKVVKFGVWKNIQQVNSCSARLFKWTPRERVTMMAVTMIMVQIRRQIYVFGVSFGWRWHPLPAEFRSHRRPFSKLFKDISLMRSAEPAGKWDEIACKLLYLRRPWETGLAVVGLDTLSCLKLCFQLILMSAASTASKSACCFMTYVEVVENFRNLERCKPEDVEVVLLQTVNVSLMSRPHCTRNTTAFRI